MLSLGQMFKGKGQLVTCWERGNRNKKVNRRGVALTRAANQRGCRAYSILLGALSPLVAPVVNVITCLDKEGTCQSQHPTARTDDLRNGVVQCHDYTVRTR